MVLREWEGAHEMYKIYKTFPLFMFHKSASRRSHTLRVSMLWVGFAWLLKRPIRGVFKSFLYPFLFLRRLSLRVTCTLIILINPIEIRLRMKKS